MSSACHFTPAKTVSPQEVMLRSLISLLKCSDPCLLPGPRLRTPLYADQCLQSSLLLGPAWFSYTSLSVTSVSSLIGHVRSVTVGGSSSLNIGRGSAFSSLVLLLTFSEACRESTACLATPCKLSPQEFLFTFFKIFETSILKA